MPDQQINQSSPCLPFHEVDDQYQYLQYIHQQELARQQQAGQSHGHKKSTSPSSDPLPHVNNSRSSGDAGGTHAHTRRACSITGTSPLVPDGISERVRSQSQSDNKRQCAVPASAPVPAGGNHQRVDTLTQMSTSDAGSGVKPETKRKSWFRRNWWW